MKLLTLAEAAEFLRKSKSWIYQNAQIPRHRPPGSRCYLFDRDELIAWVKSGQEVMMNGDQGGEEGTKIPVDREPAEVYHRNPRYR
jgi:predicted DNA-binding transcriptional regulator AlpA